MMVDSPDALGLPGLGPDLDRLLDGATRLVAAWAEPARRSTTIGQERAILRLFGVDGLDAEGRPLAAEVIDRYIDRSSERLGRGIALPFAMALVEYDSTPRQLALDIASGAVDLALEAELLREPARRSRAEAEARRLMDLAVARIDANRTAGLELVDMLGRAPWPWVGTQVLGTTVRPAADEISELVHQGADLVRVDVPMGRELLTRLRQAGVEPGQRLASGIWGQGPATAAGADLPDDPPAGSQRGLAMLRHVLDESAAERRRYVQLAIVSPGLASPEAAVVAAFERIDFVDSDPMVEIVGVGVDPDRALADRAFAGRLHLRAGSLVRIGADPLVVAPDLIAGIPSDPDTRAGRALALQVLAALLSRDDGLPAERVLVAGFPAWLVDESEAPTRAAAQVALRRAILPDHPLTFDEPFDAAGRDEGTGIAATWPAMVAALMPVGDTTALVTRLPGPGFPNAARATQAAAAVAEEIARAAPRGPLVGRALEHAQASLAAAIETVESLQAAGWDALLAEPSGDGQEMGIGGDAIAARTEAFDPIGAALAGSEEV
jgi:hypothetical protein